MKITLSLPILVIFAKPDYTKDGREMRVNMHNKDITESKIDRLISECRDDIKDITDGIFEISCLRQTNVLKAMRKEKIAENHFMPTTGYGYGDLGRDKLDKLFAGVFNHEAALVRAHWVSGTHVLYNCLDTLLRPGDIMLSATGIPYDTLKTAIGLNDDKHSSTLTGKGIIFKCVKQKCDGLLDIKSILDMIDADKNVRLIYIQKSRGYELRPSLSYIEINKCAEIIKSKYPEIIIMADNCYGEFVEEGEPDKVDLIAGSLIKNPGGGLVPTGGYAAGSKKIIDMIAEGMTTPGIGGEVGSYALGYRLFYQGIFMAPHVVGQALMTAKLFAAVFSKLNFKVYPSIAEKPYDIVQSIIFDNADQLIKFCQSIQSASPIDSHVSLEPWDMPGYQDKVIMAAGTFIQGGSVELTADAPIREPYAAYLQGGLSLEHGIAALKKTLIDMAGERLINIT